MLDAMFFDYKIKRGINQWRKIIKYQTLNELSETKA